MSDHATIVTERTVPERLKQVAGQQQQQLKQRQLELRNESEPVDENPASDQKIELQGVTLGLNAVNEIIETIDAIESGRPD